MTLKTKQRLLIAAGFIVGVWLAHVVPWYIGIPVLVTGFAFYKIGRYVERTKQ